MNQPNQPFNLSNETTSQENETDIINFFIK